VQGTEADGPPTPTRRLMLGSGDDSVAETRTKRRRRS
jgi:hypothetical protein